ncbi:hypothetical protein BGZ60DRAFT_422279 [Tricladium varicosporioides]|nr:hypothetical protein BGZ60DRAFT_422279 [Hymenoscyphus varicosporioides]
MPEANISLSPLAIRLPDRSLTSRNRAIIVFNKSYTQCTIQEANLVRASFGQDKEGNNEVGKALGSKFIYSSSGNTTYLLVAPSVDDIASSPSTHQDWDTVLKHGARFIEAWVIRIIMTKTLRSLFSYWEECPDFKPNDNLPAAYLILQDKLIPCLMSGLKNITYVMATDEDLELVERVLRCHIHIHQGSKESGLRLSAVPFDNGNDKSIEVATSFLLDWATIALKGELLRLSVHFRVYCQKNGLSGLIVQLEYAKTSAAGDILNGSGSAKNQWRAYAGTFRLSDLDRMVIEGKVKSEGLMRMVFDCKRDEMVSLEEFRRRTQKRYLAIASGVLKGVERGPAPSSSALAPSSSINENMIDLEEGEIRTEKRKHTAPDEVDMSSKRAKLTHHGTISSP